MANKQLGLTLVEVLIALFVATVIALASYGSLEASVKAQAAVQQAADDLANFQRTLSVIKDDLNQLRHRDITNQFGDVEPSFRGSVELATPIELTRGGRYRLPSTASSSLERVRFRLVGGELWRDAWFQLDRIVEEPNVSVMLLDNIDALQVRYFYREGDRVSEYDRWDQSHVDMSEKGVPTAVEITLSHATFGEVTQLVLL